MPASSDGPVLRAMAEEPAHRYATVGEMVRALETSWRSIDPERHLSWLDEEAPES